MANPYAYSGQVNQEAQIYMHRLYVRMLICFMDFAQKTRKAFLSLISVSGIGPVSAWLLSLLMTMLAWFKLSKPRILPT